MERAKRDDQDEILGQEERIEPSSGFAKGVMARVREEAAAPAPIPFPWVRAIPGMVLAAGVIGFGVYELARQAFALIQGMAVLSPADMAITQQVKDLGWVALALGVAAVSCLAPWRLARGNGLL